MIIACSKCGKKCKFEESRFQGKFSVKIMCPGCKDIIEVKNPSLDRTAARAPVPGEEQSIPKVKNPPTQKIKKSELTYVAALGAPVEALELPQGKKISIAILSGKRSGDVHILESPLCTIGRTDADIVIEDQEASRRHCQLEIKGDRILLRDLKSTNGTFVNGEKVETAILENQSEFTVGSSTMMVIVTDEI